MNYLKGPINYLRGPITVPTIFYDNDERNIDYMRGVYKEIKLVQIPEYVENPLLENAKTLQENNDLFYCDIAEFDSNSYALFLRKNIEDEIKELGETPDPSKLTELKTDLKDIVNIGVDENHLKELNDWITNKLKSSKRVDVVFDWDRTLSCVEGIFPQPFKNGTEVTLEDTLVYLMGGPKRLAYLQEFFKKIDHTKVNIFILTNNPTACKNPDNPLIGFYDLQRSELKTNHMREKFINLIQLLIPNFNPDNLIYTYDHLSKNEHGKGFAFRNFTTSTNNGRTIKRTSGGGKRRRKTIRVQKPTRRIAKKTSRKSRKRYYSP